MKRFAPAADRNRGPILEALRSALPESGRVLEVGSGTGQHVTFFAEHLPGLIFQPSDISRDALESIEAYRSETGLDNVLPPLSFDVRKEPWGIEPQDAILAINVIHISPWATCEALVHGAGQLLPAGGPLILYGPFRFNGEFTAPSNAAFDRSLRDQDPRWGVRDLSDVSDVAERAGFGEPEVIPRPANNHVVIFRKG